MLRIFVLSLLIVAALFGGLSAKPKPVAAANKHLNLWRLALWQ
jgi:uncharacterized membrane protein